MHIDSKLHLVVYLSISIVLFMIVCIAMQLFIIKKMIGLGKDRSILNEDSEMTLAQKITSNNRLSNLKDSLHCRGLAGWRRNNWTFNLSSQIVDRSNALPQDDHQFALPLMPIISTSHEYIAEATTDSKGYNNTKVVDYLEPHLEQAFPLESSQDVVQVTVQVEVVQEVDQDEVQEAVYAQSLQQSEALSPESLQDVVQDTVQEEVAQEATQDKVDEITYQEDTGSTEALSPQLELERLTALDAMTQVEPMSEVDRYHQDYFAEKIAVQHAVQQRLQAIAPEQNIAMAAARLAEIESIEDDLIEEDLIKSELIETVIPSATEAELFEEALPDVTADRQERAETQLMQLHFEQQELVEELEQLAQPNTPVQIEHVDQIERHEQKTEQSPQVEIRPLSEQHSPLDHQKIIDTYQQIIEMYK